MAAKPPKPQPAPDAGWIEYGRNRRYDPVSGAVQFDMKGEGNWEDAYNVGQYNPGNPNVDLSATPLASTDIEHKGRKLLVNQGKWSLPSADVIRNAYIAQQVKPPAPPPQQAQTSAAPQQSYLGSGGQTYGAPSQTPIQSPITIPRGFNMYSPPPVSNVGAMSDLAVQPPLIQPLGGTNNLGQMTNRAGGSFLAS